MFNSEAMSFTKFEKKIYLSSPTMHGDELTYMTEAYKTNWMSTVGKNINEIEKSISQKVGCRYAVALSSGTSALHLALKLAGEKIYGKPELGKGTLFNYPIAVSDLTFAATVNPIIYEGGKPVFIDSEQDTWNMNPLALKKAFDIHPDIKIVVIAHLYGIPAKMDEIKTICDEQGAVIIEDAAESLGATYKGKETGSLGNYNCISFNGNKIITGSSGGMLLTDDEEAAEKVRKWSTQSRELVDWYQHEEIGYNYRISNVIAGVVRGQIPHLEEHILQKKAIYNRYKEAFKDLPVKMNPFDENNSKPNYWLSCMTIEKKAMCRQVRSEEDVNYISELGKSCPTEILNAIKSINAEGRPIWKPMHMQPVFKEYSFVSVGNCAIDEDIFERGVCLPSDNKMTEEEQMIIIEVIKSCFN